MGVTLVMPVAVMALVVAVVRGMGGHGEQTASGKQRLRVDYRRRASAPTPEGPFSAGYQVACLSITSSILNCPLGCTACGVLAGISRVWPAATS